MPTTHHLSVWIEIPTFHQCVRKWATLIALKEVPSTSPQPPIPPQAYTQSWRGMHELLFSFLSVSPSWHPNYITHTLHIKSAVHCVSTLKYKCKYKIIILLCWNAYAHTRVRVFLSAKVAMEIQPHSTEEQQSNDLEEHTDTLNIYSVSFCLLHDRPKDKKTDRVRETSRAIISQ